VKTAIAVAVAFGVTLGAASFVTAGTIPFRAVGPTLGTPSQVVDCPSPSPTPTVTVTVDIEGNIVDDELQPELSDAEPPNVGGMSEGEEPSPSPSPDFTPLPSPSPSLDGDQGVPGSPEAGDPTEEHTVEGHSQGGSGEPETGSAGDGQVVEQESNEIDSGQPGSDSG